MSEPAPETPPTPTPDPPGDQELGDAGKKALDAERRNAKQAAKERDALAARLKEFEDRDKSDLQKAIDRATAAETRAQDAESRALKADVAIAKGVPVNLLAGTTKEEFEASADALLAFRGAVTPPPPSTVKIVAPGQGSTAERSVAAGAEMFANRKKPQTTTP